MSFRDPPVVIHGLRVRSPTDDEMFERLHTVAFHRGELHRAIGFDRALGKLDLETWHDRQVPACYRARVAEIVLVTFEGFRRRVFSPELLDEFVEELRRDVFEHLEPIAPAISFHRSHDEWPSLARRVAIVTRAERKAIADKLRDLALLVENGCALAEIDRDVPLDEDDLRCRHIVVRVVVPIPCAQR